MTIHMKESSPAKSAQTFSEDPVEATSQESPISNDDANPPEDGSRTLPLQQQECSPESELEESKDSVGALSSHSMKKRVSLTLSQRNAKRASLTSIGELSSSDSLASNRRSSLELRKLPVDILLQPTNIPHDATSMLSEEDDGTKQDNLEDDEEKETDCLRLLCLRPNFTLRKQMMLSFGSINLITIIIVVVVCVVLSVTAGENVKSTADFTMEQLAKQSLGYRSRYLAESLTESILLLDTVKFLREATQDRFEGHPNPSDDNVPFSDIYSGRNIYPVKAPAMPLEWNLSSNVNATNYEEFLQSRWKKYNNTPIDTRNAGFVMQGACNPLETNQMGDAYWPNCTERNNDITTGGVVIPSNQTEIYYRKGGDMVPILRAIFEQYDVITDLGLYFMNDGAGAAVNYPQYGLSTQSTYNSTGCDWLLTPNPYDPSRTIGSEEVAGKCRQEGEKVSSRLYNPLERGWCRDQALRPEEIFMIATENAWEPGEWLLILGQSVYDRMTQEFVACIYIGIDLDKISELLEDLKTSERAEATVVHFDDKGNVVASSMKNLTRHGQLAIFDAELGITKESYEELLHLIDFDASWDPVKAREAFESFSTGNADFYVSVHPMPPIPAEYDPTYHPVFFVVTSLHLEDLYESIEALNDRIDDRVSNIINFAWISGLVGLVVAALIIFTMAHTLTSPLTNMNKVANEIVGSFGDSNKEDEIRKTGDVSLETNCSPRTELRDVVSEFNTMVTNFSGASEAKSEKFRDDDMENTFPARKDLLDLYKKRSDALFRYNATGEHAEERSEEGDDDSDAGYAPLPSIPFLHFGPNHTASKAPSTRRDLGSAHSITTSKCTALFVWIVLLIATPLLFITVLVSAGVITKINVEFALSTDDIQVEYMFLQKLAMLSYARLRARFVSSYTQKFTNDLYLMSRYSSWLMFGSLDSSGTFSEMTTGVEECKNYSDDYSQCPYVIENFVCDCDWKETSYDEECDVFADKSASRRLQQFHWISELSETFDGERLGTSFPIDHFSPQSGLWWDNLTILPGSSNGTSSGYSTTYNRARSFSAVPVVQPLFNYNLGDGKETTLGLGIGFERDGTFISYEGCFSSFHVTLASWSSTPENQAALFRPELCPVGKFGFDPRCRGWYNTGKELHASGNSSLHITSPYLFATGRTPDSKTFAQTATIPIYHPMSSEHVGQTYLDFVATPIYRALQDNSYLGSEGFPILITVDLDNAQETILGPGMSEGQDSIAIVDSVLPLDANCSLGDRCEDRRNVFEKIVSSMKRGESKEVVFTRKRADRVIETMHMVYAPVYVTSIKQLDSSDYTRGVSRVKVLVYSLGLLETETQMLLPFREIEGATKKQSSVAVGVLIIVILLATGSIVYISHRLAASFSEPMIYLLSLLHHINKYGAGHDPPPVRKIKASHEIFAFSNTLGALFQIIRSANTAFFNGDLEFAYHTLSDALRLFRRLGNKKAIGVASNNMGNILLGIYREMSSAKVEKLYGLKRKEIVTQGIAHFHTAIQLGEKAYDEFHEHQGWSPSCLHFMQQLSNRYFNRGLFLLHVKSDHSNPSEIQRLGMRDIQIACDMDHEVVAYGEDVGWGSNDRAEKRFNVNIVRIRGFNILYELGYRYDWGAEELIEETVDIVRTECKNAYSDFFSDMSLAGRLEELESQVMRYYSNRGDIETAAKVAVRILIEDEVVFTEAMTQALDTLIKYAELDETNDQFRSKIAPILRSYRDTVSETIHENRQSAMEDIHSMSSSFTKSVLASSTGQMAAQRLSNASADESSRFLTMEDF